MRITEARTDEIPCFFSASREIPSVRSAPVSAVTKPPLLVPLGSYWRKTEAVLRVSWQRASVRNVRAYGPACTYSKSVAALAARRTDDVDRACVGAAAAALLIGGRRVSGATKL